MKLPRAPDGKWLLAIVAGALALRVAALGRADLWTDEIQTLHAVRLPLGDLVAERLRAGHVPLYFLLEKTWCALFGTSQLALRLPSALFGAALLVPAWSFVRRLSGERAAWAGTALLAVHPLFVELSREARMYSLLGLVLFVAADGALAALDGERPGAAFWIAVATGPFVHPTWFVAMLPFVAWLALERRAAPPETRRTSRTALTGLAASLAVLAVALVFAQPQHQELTRRPWPREIAVFVLRMFAGSELGAFRSPALGALSSAVWTVALVFGLLFAEARERAFALWIGLGVPAVSVAAGLLGGLPWGPARYLAFGAAGWVFLAAITARHRFPRTAAPTVGLWLAAFSVAAVATPDAAWSAAAAALRDDPSPVVVDDEPSRIVLSHYLGRDVTVGAPPRGASEWRHASLVVEGGTRRVEVTRNP